MSSDITPFQASSAQFRLPATPGKVDKPATNDAAAKTEVTPEAKTETKPKEGISRKDFISQNMEAAKNLSADKKAQERATLEAIYGKADKDHSGKIELPEMDEFTKLLDAHKADTEGKNNATTMTYTTQHGHTTAELAKQLGTDEATLLQHNPSLKKGQMVAGGSAITLPVNEKTMKEVDGFTQTYGADKTKVTYHQPEIKEPKETKETKETKGPDNTTTKVPEKTETEGVTFLQQNFDQVAGGDGRVSKEDLQKNMPEGPAKDALLKHFDVIKFGTVEQGAEAWQNLSKGDVDRLSGAMAGGKSVASYSQELAKDNPAAKEALDEVGKQEAAQHFDKTKAEAEAAISQKAGHPVKIEWADDMSQGDKLRQLDMLKRMASDSSYDNTWKKFDRIELDVLESKSDSGDPNNLKGYVEEKGKTLKINQPGNGWGGGSDLTDVELDKQVRAMEQVRDKANRETSVGDLKNQVGEALSKKAGHPVQVGFDSNMSPEDQLKQLNHLKGMLEDPAFDKVWAYYDKVEFNTFKDRRDSGDPNNLTDYVQVDARTLKLNNASNDGLTDAEMTKQRRAVEHLRDNGKPYGK